MMKGVITADLVDSTKIATAWRQTIVDALSACASELKTATNVKIEMFRGDSFQAVVDSAEYALTAAIALRAKLRAATPERAEMWDARLSLGIGEVSFESNNIVTSDGEAFRLSGHAFDSIGKRRLVISTPWPDFNDGIDLVTRFADEQISTWTARQAQVVYQALLFPDIQQEMADALGFTRQNFNYHWNSAKGQLILDYIAYYKSLMAKYNLQ